MAGAPTSLGNSCKYKSERIYSACSALVGATRELISTAELGDPRTKIGQPLLQSDAGLIPQLVARAVIFDGT